ncbi:hypothetical protein HNR34_001492 [Geobacillus subterraneus]
MHLEKERKKENVGASIWLLLTEGGAFLLLMRLAQSDKIKMNKGVCNFPQ